MVGTSGTVLQEGHTEAPGGIIIIFTLGGIIGITTGGIVIINSIITGAMTSGYNSGRLVQSVTSRIHSSIWTGGQAVVELGSIGGVAEATTSRINTLCVPMAPE